MTVRVNYVPAPPVPGGGGAERAHLKRELAEMAGAVKKELEDTGGFLKLVSRGTGETVYYHQGICGIVGDLSYLVSLGVRMPAVSLAQEILKRKRMGPFARIGGLPGEVLCKREYEMLFSASGYGKQWKLRGWQDLSQINVIVVSPQVRIGPADRPVYLIPVFRCVENQWEITSDSTPRELTGCFLLHGFLPALYAGMQEGVWRQLCGCITQECGKEAATAGPRMASIVKPDESRLAELRKYYQEVDLRAASLAGCKDTIFGIQEGCWDLYPYADLTREQISGGDGVWYEVEDFYARDPLEDVASGTVQVAIDFGTKSTTVAIFDEKGDITLLPMGDMSNLQGLKETAYENPTILEFVDIRRFLDDYQRMHFRPETRFDDICAAWTAQDDYEGSGEDTEKQMFRYLTHLKQWVSHPGSILEGMDEKGEVIRLKCDASGDMEGELNPIEIYAYYIGRNIHNMHRKRVYLKYLLSYTSTCTEISREWIRASFEKGLKKSLPPAVGENAERMKEFSVKLWRDEATAYAVSAVSKYLEAGYRGSSPESFLVHELEAGEIFYGVYDFGGGTLDFSFGTMCQEEEQDVYRQLGCGGSATLGCENLLELLAYEIFRRDENAAVLHDKNIRCEKPFIVGHGLDEYQIIGSSGAARFNSSSLITYLRKFWIEGDMGENFRMKDETGAGYEVELQEEPAAGESGGTADRVIRLKMSRKEIESFFEEKVTEGIYLFLQYYKEVMRTGGLAEGKICTLFLAGNASRAARVRDCLDRVLADENLTERFCIKDALPVPDEREEYRKHPGRVPSAKSGVVYGMLLARPGATDIRIENRLPDVHFRYFIGKRKRDRAFAYKGRFELLMHAGAVPAADDRYRFLMQIPQAVFELLYTDDGGYAPQSVQRPVGDGVKVMAVHLPERCVGRFLYVRAAEKSVEVLELCVSETDKEWISEAERVGYCNFGKDRFEPGQEIEENA